MVADAPMKQGRRRMLALAGGSAMLPLLAPGTVQAQMPTEPPPLGSGYALLVPKATQGAPVRIGRVTVDTPTLADNGHSVPVRVVVQSAMRPDDHVRSITLLSDRNPRPVIVKAWLGPRAGRAELSTRVRLNGTQRLLALAEMSDGSWWSGEADVVVTESACLDAS
jgi:sulfur-oxidizing protein SoxY